MSEEIAILLEGLSPESKELVQKYFLFAKRKRTLHLKDVEGEFIEFKAASLFDDSYNKADVTDIINGLLAIIKVTIENEQKDVMHTFAELLRQVLKNADEAKVPISVEMAALDNIAAISSMGFLEKNVLEGKAGLAPLGSLKPKPSAGLHPLAPIGQTQAPAGPSEAELKLEEENKRLNEKLQKIQQQYTTMMQEKSKLSAELTGIKESTTNALGHDAAVQHDLQSQISDLKIQLEKKENEIAVSQRELTGKLGESNQFKTIKKLLTQKNQQVKDLRTKLLKYEPPTDESTIELQESSSSDED
eukprot:NODE_2793_length_1089_cov_118.603950_g2663_i0.p1 GENE.NODE_2793_length_1089_cov_118.603950_g2663_i0~~NODE_2793_length_1089_cov_118.603950_g2663_i0.p1  ORF type:complete len:303 (+),score=113.29 NODE_2793_length_1089_cov_118.603950_g2663_i0:56-964(+)